MSGLTFFRHLHVKLAVAGCLVQCLLSLLLMVNQMTEAEKKATNDLRQTIRQTTPLLTASLIEPLLQRDEATLRQILEDAQSDGLMAYYVLVNHRGQVITRTVGMENKYPAEADDLEVGIPWDRPDALFHQSLPITFASQNLATLHYAIPLDSAISARAQLRRQGVFLALAGVVLGTLAFSLLGLGVARRLRALGKASEDVIRGNYHCQVSISGQDELAQLGRAFNNMSQAIQERIRAITESEQRQTHYLHIAQSEHARLLALLQSMRLGVLMTDQKQRVLYFNESFQALWGLTDKVRPEDLDLLTLMNASSRYRESPTAQRLVWFRPTPGGSERMEIHFPELILEQTSQAVSDADGAVIGHLWLFEDVTHERAAQETIHRLAERDALTGVLNRHTFTKLLHSTLSSKRRQSITLLYLDLDNFKMVNDVHGHAFGDHLLIQVADTMGTTLRPDDVIGRQGGDEFVILLQQVEPKQIKQLCERLIRNISNVSGKLLKNSQNAGRIGCSIGVAFFPGDARDADQLLAAADTAMYAAKANGRNTWQMFNPNLPQTASKAEWLIWGTRINEALEQEKFQLFLQGIHDSRTGELKHYEVLCRLPDAERPGQFYMPMEFIQHAESSGQILQIDRWVLRTAIEYLARHPESPPIAVNISARTLLDNQLATYISGVLSEEQVSPQRLHLELTETAVLDDLDMGAEHILALRELGCQIGLDDFGSGFTSLAYLKRLHADYIKIDGLFIWGLAEDPQNAILLRAIVDIAHQLGRKVIAEWIETPEHLDAIRSFDIDLVQGYLFDRPSPLP